MKIVALLALAVSSQHPASKIIGSPIQGSLQGLAVDPKKNAVATIEHHESFDHLTVSREFKPEGGFDLKSGDLDLQVLSDDLRYVRTSNGKLKEIKWDGEGFATQLLEVSGATITDFTIHEGKLYASSYGKDSFGKNKTTMWELTEGEFSRIRYFAGKVLRFVLSANGNAFYAIRRPPNDPFIKDLIKAPYSGKKISYNVTFEGCANTLARDNKNNVYVPLGENGVHHFNARLASKKKIIVPHTVQKIAVIPGVIPTLYLGGKCEDSDEVCFSKHIDETFDESAR